MTTFVRLNGAIVAVAGPTRYYLGPALVAKAPGDPSRQLAALMCVYAQRLDTAGRGDEYSDADAEAFARLVLQLAAGDEPA